eukprot:1145460-Pleurochrysis_carterae.AAC.1
MSMHTLNPPHMREEKVNKPGHGAQEAALSLKTHGRLRGQGIRNSSCCSRQAAAKPETGAPCWAGHGKWCPLREWSLRPLARRERPLTAWEADGGK